MEEWKDIKDWEGIYQISNQGRLKSFKAVSSGRILSNINQKGGYFSVVLRDNVKRQYARIHRLVAQAFIMNPEHKLEINHKDGNKQNNSANNLEWATRAENWRHAIATRPEILSGMNNYNRFERPKSILQFSTSGAFIALYPSCAEAARTTGVCHRNIHQVAAKSKYKPGKTRRQAGGFFWVFQGESQS